MLNNVNARIAETAKLEGLGKSIIFDSTTLDLVKKACEAGATEGEHIHSDIGCYILKSAPHDDRTGFKMWATRVW